MLADRFYTRGDYPRSSTTALVWLVAMTVSSYVVQLALLLPWLAGNTNVTEPLRLTVRALEQGQVWTLVTHGFLYAAGNPVQLLLSLLALILIGRELEPQLGSRRFVGVFAASLVAGAACWLAVHWRNGGIHTGPSAAIFGLLVVLARLYENQRLTLMPFFVFSVTVRPMHFVYALAALDGLLLLVFELPGGATPFGWAPSAHLGGMLAGWVYFRFFHAGNGWDRAPGFSLPTWKTSAGESDSAEPASERPRRAAHVLRADVDRILDKINSQGFAALTEEEKQTLDEAKDLLSRR